MNIPQEVIDRMANALEDLAFAEITPEVIDEGQVAWQAYVDALDEQLWLGDAAAWGSS